MTQLGVPRKRMNTKRKYYDLSLHTRIDLFAKNAPETGSHLLALKWLGNSGSHESEVSRHELLDAFEVLEHVLLEVIDQRSAKVAALARKLTMKHGR